MTPCGRRPRPGCARHAAAVAGGGRGRAGGVAGGDSDRGAVWPSVGGDVVDLGVDEGGRGCGRRRGRPRDDAGDACRSGGGRRRHVVAGDDPLDRGGVGGGRSSRRWCGADGAVDALGAHAGFLPAWIDAIDGPIEAAWCTIALDDKEYEQYAAMGAHLTREEVNGCWENSSRARSPKSTRNRLIRNAPPRLRCSWSCPGVGGDGFLVGVDCARWGEPRLSVGADVYFPVGVVQQLVVVAAEEYEVVEVGGSAVGPSVLRGGLRSGRVVLRIRGTRSRGRGRSVRGAASSTRCDSFSPDSGAPRRP